MKRDRTSRMMAFHCASASAGTLEGEPSESVPPGRAGSHPIAAEDEDVCPGLVGEVGVVDGEGAVTGEPRLPPLRVARGAQPK
ncbi:MAG: hypothetical protein HND47_15970 [Chloroflexi bacterium]|nr:hypothetical protein [Chloroflexota bacterium]